MAGSIESVHPVPTGNVAMPEVLLLLLCPHTEPPLTVQVATFPEMAKVPVQVVQAPPVPTVQPTVMDEIWDAVADEVGMAGEIADMAGVHGVVVPAEVV